MDHKELQRRLNTLQEKGIIRQWSAGPHAPMPNGGSGPWYYIDGVPYSPNEATKHVLKLEALPKVK